MVGIWMPTMEDIIKAAKRKLNAHEFILKLEG